MQKEHYGKKLENIQLEHHIKDQAVETEFSYSPKSESIPETTTNFEVDAGSNGTFDVEYTIKGGTIKDMIVDSDIFAIIVQIRITR